MSQKKKWSAKAKLEIALLALKGTKTINEICEHYQVAPSQVHAWKKLLVDEGTQLFEKTNKSSKKKVNTASERLESQLYEKIGQLTVERDFLKKTWETFHENDDEH